MTIQYIGITERADPTINLGWQKWVAEGKPAILITKMPRLLLPMLPPNPNVIVHCTITGLGGTVFEPNVDDADTSLRAYRNISKVLGPERVVLRVDPIIPNIDHEVWHGKPLHKLYAAQIGKMRISFIDQYPHVKERFAKAGIKLAWDSFHAPLADRIRIWHEMGEPEVCCEPDMPSIPCVSQEDCRILGVEPADGHRGQRPLCGCLANKRELLKVPPKCTYGCLYCYWK